MKEKLIEACNTNNLAAVELMSKYIDYKIPCDETLNAFKAACTYGHIGIVEYFLNNQQYKQTLFSDLTYTGSEIYNKKTKDVVDTSLQALINASRNGHLPVVQRLMSEDYIQAIAGSANNMVLENAVQGGNLDIIELLLKEDTVMQAVIADLKIKNKHESANKSKIINIFIQKGDLKVIKILMSNDLVKNTLLIGNVYEYFQFDSQLSKNQEEIVEFLLLDILSKENILAHLYSYLEYAAFFGHIKFLEKLLQMDNVNKHIADPNCNLFKFAYFGNQTDTIKMLEKLEIFKETKQEKVNDIFSYCINRINASHGFFSIMEGHSQIKVKLGFLDHIPTLKYLIEEYPDCKKHLKQIIMLPKPNDYYFYKSRNIEFNQLLIELDNKFFDSEFLLNIFNESDSYYLLIIHLGAKMIQDNVFCSNTKLNTSQSNILLWFLEKNDLQLDQKYNLLPESKFVLELLSKVYYPKQFASVIRSNSELNLNSDAIKFLQMPFVRNKLKDILQKLPSPEKNRLRTLIGCPEIPKPLYLVGFNLIRKESFNQESTALPVVKNPQATIKTAEPRNIEILEPIEKLGACAKLKKMFNTKFRYARLKQN